MMAYDLARDPMRGRRIGRSDYGTVGEHYTLGTADIVLTAYSFVEVFVPSTAAEPVYIYYVPVGQAGAIRKRLHPGTTHWLPHQVKTVRGTGNGSTAGLELLTTRAPAGGWDTGAG